MVSSESLTVDPKTVKLPLRAVPRLSAAGPRSGIIVLVVVQVTVFVAVVVTVLVAVLVAVFVVVAVMVEVPVETTVAVLVGIGVIVAVEVVVEVTVLVGVYVKSPKPPGLEGFELPHPAIKAIGNNVSIVK
jgi:hypothetical protein